VIPPKKYLCTYIASVCESVCLDVYHKLVYGLGCRLVKSNGEKRLQRQRNAKERATQMPTDNRQQIQIQIQIQIDIRYICVYTWRHARHKEIHMYVCMYVYVCCHFINKTNNILNIYESAIAQLICCCSAF